MSPPVFIILGLCIFFGASASLLMIVSVSSDHWESVTFDPDKLRAIEGIQLNDSVFRPQEGFYQISIRTDPGDGSNSTVYYLRDSIGGIWRYCDRLSGEVKHQDNIEGIWHHFDELSGEVKHQDNIEGIWHHCDRLSGEVRSTG